MKGQLTIYERLKPAAQKGRTTYKTRLHEVQIDKLEKKGFTINKIKHTSFADEWFCIIDWKNPTTKDGAAAQLLRITLKTLSDNLK